MIDLIQKSVLTEKTISLVANNQYTFDVDIRLTKPQIKKIFEKLFNLEVLSVNSHLSPIRKKRLGLNQGYKKRYKRIIIRIKPNQKIPIMKDVNV